MKDYAIIRIRGNQYKVSEGDEILVPGTCDEKVETEFLLRVIGDKVTFGKPLIGKLSVNFKIVEEKLKGKKIEVMKYKAKSRYRKKIGFRSISTKLLLNKLV